MNKLRRSRSDRWLTGVCGGIAEYMDVPSIAVRLVFLVASPLFWVYIIMAFLIPEED
ncbi:PspC domain-containing protein [Marinilactibacillus kalidii]|uniref:PspC domain-containing protein n=1 Tax=Marinilactibacillus kalidii TaxID=2820274 RepID=UPI001FC97C25|nr:PspC domain-containing protein [Marinilactibacillus kalidii]